MRIPFFLSLFASGFVSNPAHGASSTAVWIFSRLLFSYAKKPENPVIAGIFELSIIHI